MFISPAPHYLKVRLTRREWRGLGTQAQAKQAELCDKVMIFSYETYLFVARDRWARLCATVPQFAAKVRTHFQPR